MDNNGTDDKIFRPDDGPASSSAENLCSDTDVSALGASVLLETQRSEKTALESSTSANLTSNTLDTESEKAEESRCAARPLSQYILGDSYHLASEKNLSRESGEIAVQTDKERIEALSGPESISMSLSAVTGLASGETPSESSEKAAPKFPPSEAWEKLKSTSGRIEYPFYDSEEDDFPFTFPPVSQASESPNKGNNDKKASETVQDALESTSQAACLSLSRDSIILSREESVPVLAQEPQTPSKPQESISSPSISQSPPFISPLHPKISFFTLSLEEETLPTLLCDQISVGVFPIFRRYLSLLADRDKMSKQCH